MISFRSREWSHLTISHLYSVLSTSNMKPSNLDQFRIMASSKRSQPWTVMIDKSWRQEIIEQLHFTPLLDNCKRRFHWRQEKFVMSRKFSRYRDHKEGKEEKWVRNERMRGGGRRDTLDGRKRLPMTNVVWIREQLAKKFERSVWSRIRTKEGDNLDWRRWRNRLNPTIRSLIHP